MLLTPPQITISPVDGGPALSLPGTGVSSDGAIQSTGPMAPAPTATQVQQARKVQSAADKAAAAARASPSYQNEGKKKKKSAQQKQEAPPKPQPKAKAKAKAKAQAGQRPSRSELFNAKGEGLRLAGVLPTRVEQINTLVDLKFGKDASGLVTRGHDPIFMFTPSLGRGLMLIYPSKDRHFTIGEYNFNTEPNHTES